MKAQRRMPAAMTKMAGWQWSVRGKVRVGRLVGRGMGVLLTSWVGVDLPVVVGGLATEEGGGFGCDERGEDDAVAYFEAGVVLL